MKSYDQWSLLFVMIGGFVAYMIFPPISLTPLGKDSLWCIPIGVSIYIIGIVCAFISLFKREKGWLKYISMATLLLFTLYFVLLSHVFGGTI
ncbi:hypothetical protein MUN89_02830 [Halobacillus salinarum]|uniref:Uncharacterized protein n=1 Tax=Halobacillus salinarum TaxID=2932257 RepID=A0ABY4EKA7_9BACI|nr:hypothetical protein [Halobacillus salinarum]UOQ44903.1 hypothetical protein MUN89_02830 [Halobacillus salinarum]